MKRIQSITLLLLFPLLSFAFEVDGIAYNITSEDDLTVEVTRKYYYSGEIAIPGRVTYEGKDYAVTSIGSSAFEYCGDLTSITIPSSVTSIGNSAFRGCSGLTSVTIPSSVTSIGWYAFSSCSGLTSIIVEDGNTVYDSRDNCNAIVRTSDNTLIAGCKNTVIPTSVTSIGYMAFEGCSGLTSLTIPTSVTSIGNSAFRGCSGLKSVAVEWSSPLEIDQNVFEYSNYQNATLYVPNDMREAYESVDVWREFGIISKKFEITDGTLSDWQGLQFTANSDESTCYVSGHNNSYRSDIIIPSYFRARQVTSIGANAFAGCSELTSLTVPWETPIEIDVSVFNGSNYQNATLYVPKGSKTVYEAVNVWKDFVTIKEVFDKSDGKICDAQGVKYTANDDESTCYVSGHESNYSATIVIPEFYGGRSVTSIGDGAFYGCSGLTSLTIPENVTSIGYMAFEGCSGLTSLTIPSSVTSIGNRAFSNCSDLASIIVEEGNTIYDSRDNCNAIIRTTENTLIAGCKNSIIPSSVTSIGDWAFNGCSGLTSLTIPTSVTSIGDWAFYDCRGLTSVTIPSSVSSIGSNAFSGCSGLTSLTIPTSVTSIGKSAFEGCSGLTSLTIPSSVTSIGSEAFYNCSGLTSLTIPSSVTSIGDRAFSNCSGLTSIIVEEGNTVYDSRDNCNAIIKTADNTLIAGCKNTVIPSSVTSIGDYAFYYCSGLTSVAIPEGVTSIGGDAFHGCDGLTSVAIPEGVTSIGNSAFWGCSGLASVTIPSSVTSIGDMAFDGCSSLTSVTIPEGVTSIGDNAIRGCSGLTSVTIPEGVTSIGDMAFVGCSSSTSVTIPSSVTSIGMLAFGSCSGLTSVIVGWETPFEIDGSVFSYSNYNNATLYVPKGTKAAYEAAAVWQDFGDIKEKLDKSDGALSDAQGIRYTANDDESTCYVSGHDDTYNSDIIIPNSFKGRHVTSIGTGAFFGCSNLTSLTVRWGTPIAIDGTVFEGSNCQNAVLRVPLGSKAAYDVAEGWSDFGEIVEVFTEGRTSDSQGVIYKAYYEDELICRVVGHEATYSSAIIIPEFYKGSRVTSIAERAFQNCSDLTSVTIPEDVMSIGGLAFYGCSGLTSVTIPSSVTSIGDQAFRDCSGLASIIIEEGNTIYDSRDNCNAIIRTDDNTLITGCKNTVIPSSVTSIGVQAFHSCSGLTSLTIPSSVTSIGSYAFYDCTGLTSLTIPSSVTSIGGSAFYGCSGLTSVTIPSSVTSISDWTFSWCSGLTSVTIPSSVTSIDNNAFSSCSGLTSLTIPSSVTSIGMRAFYKCSGLTSVTIPSSVSSIGSYAFYDCTGLTSVIVGWETPLEINSDVFNAYNYNNATLYVPKGTKAAYEAAAVWQDFGAIFEGNLPQENVELTDASAIDNVIYIEPFDAMKGTEVTVSLRMKNTAGIRGFQFDMYLPLGVTVKKDGNNRFICLLNDNRKPSGSAHTLTVSEQQDGSIRFLCGSQYDETFTGTEGEILTVQLCVDEKMLAGMYPIILKNVKLSETNINNFYLTETVQSALNVIQYIPGDISGDGVIDVSDYIGVANYILGTPQEGIIAAAADVNKDNLVDVSDYIGVANLILYNNIYGQTVNAARRAQRRAVTDVSTLDNVIYISPFEAASNGETQVSIRMKNTVGIRGFQFDLYLPDGMTAVKDGNNRYVSTLSNGRKPAGDQHTLTLSEQPDGAIRFLCGSQYDETFTGTDGEIATLTINVDAGVEAQDYPIYLRNMKLTETDINNFYTTDEIETLVTVTGPADNRVLLSETSTTAPEAASNVDVRVKRTINANEWSTICLPFAMTTEQVQTAFGNDVELGDFNDYTPTYDGDNLLNISVNFVEATAIEANHPYVIKVSESISEFTVDGVTIEPEDVPCVSFGYETGKKPVVYHPADFIGTYVADFDFYNDASKRAIFLSGNKFYYATANTRHMKAFRAYFDFDDVLTDAENAASRIRMSLDDETTSISDATRLNDNGKMINDNYYGLDGRKLTKRPTKKGVYVRGGRKVIIK